MHGLTLKCKQVILDVHLEPSPLPVHSVTFSPRTEGPLVLHAVDQKTLVGMGFPTLRSARLAVSDLLCNHPYCAGITPRTGGNPGVHKTLTDRRNPPRGGSEITINTIDESQRKAARIAGAASAPAGSDKAG